MRTTIVVPRVLGVDVANAVAEVRYVQLIPALVDRHHRPMFSRGGGDTRCTVVEQRPHARTEVETSDLTVTVTMTVRCRHAGPHDRAGRRRVRR